MANNEGSLDHGQELWSAIQENPLYVEKLFLLCHGQKELQQVGYVMTPFSDEKLSEKMRCQNCGGQINKKKRIRSTKPPKKVRNEDLRAELSAQTSPPPPWIDTRILVTQVMGNGESVDQRLERIDLSNQTDLPTEQQKEAQLNVMNRLICHYHPGRVGGLAGQKQFSCCRLDLKAPGCISSAAHLPAMDLDTGLREYWAFHHTPPLPPSLPRPRSNGRSYTQAHRNFLAARTPRAAVALDCEMGTGISSESEVIRITMVDFFTQEVLIDSLVQPSIPMRHYNTRFSGVTASDMRDAVRSRNCIFGRDMAQEQVWRFVGPDTVIVVHGGNNDLTALRMIHPRIIDTFILESYGEAVAGGRSLKNACQQRLGRAVQSGKEGHCSLEDALACRELVHWLAEQIPA